MTCDFPSKKSRKEIFKKKEQSNRCNIKALKYDPVVVELFSKTLDSELEDTTECGNVDTLSDTLITALHKASDVAIPKYVKEKDIKPWTDERFLELIEARNKAKNTDERKELNKEVKKNHDQTKNEY